LTDALQLSGNVLTQVSKWLAHHHADLVATT
jgi:hypothetical protein